MKRQTEPELMDDYDQSLYFSEARRKYSEDAFVYFYKQHFGVTSGTVVDLGCGPGKYLIRLCEEFPNINLIGYDASQPMIELANKNIEQSNLLDRIEIRKSLFNDIEGKFDCVISSGTLHHSHNPLEFWQSVKQISTGKIFVMDLIRPEKEELVHAIVKHFANDEHPSFRNDFTNSLKAAFTKEEIEEQLKEVGLNLNVSVYGTPDVVQIVIIHGNSNVIN